MIKTIIILIIIANSLHTSAYAYEEENKIDPPVEAPVLPEKLLKVLPESPTGLPEDPKPEYKPEAEDLKTDATYWPFFRTYYYPYYRYRYYLPRVYHRYYYWW